MQTSTEFVKKIISEKQMTPQLSNVGYPEISDYISQAIKELTQSFTLVSVVGGVASGKTSLVKKLIEHIPHSDFLGTDDYVKGTREYRRQEIVAKNKSPYEKYDFEFLKAKIHEIRNLSEGDTVKLPEYDSHTGLAIAAGEENFTKEIGKVDLLFVEGDFQPLDNQDLLIYFHVSDQTRTDNRIERDQKKRNELDLVKLKSDISTRDQQQHFPITLPQAEKADIIISAVRNKEGEYEFTLYS